MDDREECIDELEDGVVEITHVELKRQKRIKRNDNNLKALWDNIMHTNMHIAEIPEGEEREKGVENIFEDVIGEILSNLGKKTNIQVQEAQRVPKKTTTRHTVIKMAKIKNKYGMLKSARENEFHIRELP